jgi:predicted transcriptional regulator
MPELAYLRFLNLLDAMRGVLPRMDAPEQSLLHMVVAAWHQDKLLTVTQAMNSSKDLSPATVHRKIQTLQAKGLLEIVSDDKDSRFKYLSPTRKAIEYFEQLSICMRQAGLN